MGEPRPVNGRPATETRTPRLVRGRPRSFVEWTTLRRWGKLPPWEIDIPGYLLRLARQSAGITQTELADRVGITQQAVSQTEGWTSNPTVNLMRRWLAACGWRLELKLNKVGAVELPGRSTPKARI